MILIKLLAVMALTFLVLYWVQADTLYKWVDSQGNVSYHDVPPPEGSGYRVEEKSIRTESGGGLAQNLPASKFPVVLYSVPKCASCDLARVYLEKRKTPYTEKNVQSDVKIQEELKAKSGSVSVPTITVGDKVMQGYLESLLEGELDAAGYPKIKSTENTENQ